MRDGEVPAELWSASVHPAAAPAWVMLLVGQSAKNLVFFSVRPGPGPQYVLLGPDTTDGTVCVFEDGPLRRLVVLCDAMATRAPVAGRTEFSAALTFGGCFGSASPTRRGCGLRRFWTAARAFQRT